MLLFARGDPRDCQCAYLRMTDRDYDHSTSGREPIRAPQGHPARPSGAARRPGLLAYDDAGPVGWVSFGPREEFARLVASPGAAAGR